MNRYKTKNSSNDKYNAQLNLEVRTHYVDDDTLRFHKSRIVFSNAYCDGLLFAIIESTAIDYHNTKRGFRYVIFDLFGNVVERPDLEHCFKTQKAAREALRKALEYIDARAINRRGLEQYEARNEREIARLHSMIEGV